MAAGADAGGVMQAIEAAANWMGRAGADTQYRLPIFTTDTPYAGEKGSRIG